MEHALPCLLERLKRKQLIASSRCPLGVDVTSLASNARRKPEADLPTSSPPTTSAVPSSVGLHRDGDPSPYDEAGVKRDDDVLKVSASPSSRLPSPPHRIHPRRRTLTPLALPLSPNIMVARLSAVFSLALAVVGSAALIVPRVGEGSCDTGAIQCCQSTHDAKDPSVSILLGLLNVVVDGLDGLIGLGCSPINVIGVASGNACSATTVCCQNNASGNLINIGCIPIIL
ncbi:fungal hydrophobin-domain-containing protein [Epithele typhae]|uniref:fungal hydrophobin-domain-containing protein n=1 Tax=Epithele typhae TaxID=378194 RepID=UPI002008E302|nr:fungal hydrophobin-domain-containing protein [Epithele typhae]KAH9919984.1 fungal hydrophobin-domain-containing protein [Epithele typhae]